MTLACSSVERTGRGDRVLCRFALGFLRQPNGHDARAAPAIMNEAHRPARVPAFVLVRAIESTRMR
jgi:hypothetical protein